MAWVEDRLPSFPGPEELICQVFDDSGIDDALIDGIVFSANADEILKQLSRAAATIDASGRPEEFVRGEEWKRVVHLAEKALAAIAHDSMMN
jgi:hypothetical protein